MEIQAYNPFKWRKNSLLVGETHLTNQRVPRTRIIVTWSSSWTRAWCISGTRAVQQLSTSRPLIQDRSLSIRPTWRGTTKYWKKQGESGLRYPSQSRGKLRRISSLSPRSRAIFLSEPQPQGWKLIRSRKATWLGVKSYTNRQLTKIYVSHHLCWARALTENPLIDSQKAITWKSTRRDSLKTHQHLQSPKRIASSVWSTILRRASTVVFKSKHRTMIHYRLSSWIRTRKHRKITGTSGSRWTTL